MGRTCCSCACRWVLAPALVAVIAARWAVRCPQFPTPPDTSVSLGDQGWERRLQDNLDKHGYARIVQLLNRSEAEGLRRLASSFCYGEQRKALPLSWGGYTVPAFLDLPEFKEARWLVEDPRLQEVLRAVFRGAEHRFASHNDVGCDFVGVWHKDILRGPQKKYQVHDVWTPDETGEQHEIYKVLFYLQDHIGDTRSVKVVPGSHKLRDISLERGFASVHPSLGDAVIIDQRISHSGNTFYDPLGSGRIFMQVGFGKANRFTEEFARGTADRQEGYQKKMLQASQTKGIQTVLTDAKFFVLGLAFTALPPTVLNMFADLDVKKYKTLGRLIFGSNAGPQK